jgi:hypothetical protein
VRNRNLDEDRLKTKSIQPMIDWFKAMLTGKTERGVDYCEVVTSFTACFYDFFSIFVAYLHHIKRDFFKLSCLALYRMVFVYFNKVIQRFDVMEPKLFVMVLVYAIPILLHFAENKITQDGCLA